MVEREETTVKFFIAHQQFAKTIEPTMTDLHNPTAGFLCGMPLLGLLLLRAAGYMRNVAVTLNDLQRRLSAIPGIETQMLGAILIRAVAATFDRRQTGIPNGVPVGLSEEFANDPLKEKQWNAFLRKNSIAPKPLSEVVTDLRDFLMPVLAAAVQR